MTEAKHTPGPWKAIRPGYGMRGKYAGCWGIVPADSPSSPAFVYLPPGQTDIQEANARLIAAAPELLRALEVAFKVLENLVAIKRLPANNAGSRLARTAIAKSRGE